MFYTQLVRLKILPIPSDHQLLGGNTSTVVDLLLLEVLLANAHKLCCFYTVEATTMSVH